MRAKSLLPITPSILGVIFYALLSLCIPTACPAQSALQYDLNGDNCFDLGDFNVLLLHGVFETRKPATFHQGDFNGDGFFGIKDLIVALGSGLFGQCVTADMPTKDQNNQHGENNDTFQEPSAKEEQGDKEGADNHNTQTHTGSVAEEQETDPHHVAEKTDKHEQPDETVTNDSSSETPEDTSHNHDDHDDLNHHAHRAWGLPAAAYPVGAIGTNRSLLQTVTNARPRENAQQGAFRSTCHYSHMDFADPIVKPGQPSASHLHAFFGNTAVNAFTTAESLLSTGNSTCNGGILNRSSYWVPALLDGSDMPLRPASMMVYYKTSGNAALIRKIPNGLKIVSGNMAARSPQNSEIVNYTCAGRWNGNHSRIGDTDCRVGEQLLMRIYFPVCWNGELDSHDHKSHMAELVHGSCPRSHPTLLPRLSLQVAYDVPGSHYKQWRLSSDMYDVKNGNGGMSLHADYLAAWDTNIAETWTRECLNKKRDCHGQLLGDGRALSPAPRTVGTQSRVNLNVRSLELVMGRSAISVKEIAKKFKPERKKLRRKLRTLRRKTKGKIRKHVQSIFAEFKPSIKGKTFPDAEPLLRVIDSFGSILDADRVGKRKKKMLRRIAKHYVELFILFTMAQ